MLPWRIAATTILRSDAFDVLMLRRGATAKFMPNSFVFPGGILEPEFDLVFPESKTNYNSESSGITLGLGETDLPLRVAAARELFEEAGLLLTYDAHTRECRVVTSENDRSLIDWREKVKKDPAAFRDLFSLRTMLDVNSLVPWSNWLTPASYKRRFDTVFFVIPLKESSAIEFCEKEMQGSTWDLPSKFIEKSCNGENLALPPPQFYELARLKLMNSNDPEKLRKMTNSFKICPQVVLNSEAPGIRTTLLPGDHLFDFEKRFTGTELKTMRNEDLRTDKDLPIHRITFSEDPIYTNLELHISNLEKMDTKPHLFSWLESVDEQRKRLLAEVLHKPRSRE
ncbi:hypothetical protein FO519_002328 [Halicephalobus sp. NKZ332]|nr:hypothetical protein FO519_002328 [Halicephalobus sp. NKZ332]